VSIIIYGIKNCETMNKARAWLDKHGVAMRSATTRPPASIANDDVILKRH